VGQSEYIDSWNNYTSGNGAAPTITTNYIESPEGIVNATRLQLETNGTSSTDASGVLQSIALDGSSTYIFSFWIKSNSGSSAELSTFINSSFGVQFTATTEWQRLDFEVVSNSTNPRNFGIVARGNYHQSVDVSFWGAQLEQGSYPTSYIPNHSGGSETRNADECTKTTISGLIGQTEGTIYCEFEYNGAADSGVFNRIIGLGTGVTQNRILLAKNDTTAELVAFAVTGGTTQVFQAIAGTSIIGHHKVAISYKANEYKVYLDGELEFTDTSASVPATTDVYIGTAEDGTTNNELGGVVKQSIIYKEVLSEDNCKALTTL
jgi:hypothetical protein